MLKWDVPQVHLFYITSWSSTGSQRSLVSLKWEESLLRCYSRESCCLYLFLGRWQICSWTKGSWLKFPWSLSIKRPRGLFFKGTDRSTLFRVYWIKSEGLFKTATFLSCDEYSVPFHSSALSLTSERNGLCVVCFCLVFVFEWLWKASLCFGPPGWMDTLPHFISDSLPW